MVVLDASVVLKWLLVDPAREPVSEAMTDRPYSVPPGAEVREVVQETVSYTHLTLPTTLRV